MRGVERGLHGVAAVPLLAGCDVFLRKGKIVEYPFCVGPLPKEIVVLEKVVVTERGMRHHERLHRHRVFFEQVGNARTGVDHDLVGERRIAKTIQNLLARKQLAERPMIVHQRHGKRGIGIEHLFGRNDLDLIGINIELQIVQRDLFDGLVGAVQRRKIPLHFSEKQLAHADASAFLNSS